MRSIDSSSPRNANGAIIAPVLTPVTTSNCGRASSPLTLPQPLSTPAPNAPQSPPPEMISRSMVARAFREVFATSRVSASTRLMNFSMSCSAICARAAASASRAAKSSGSGRSGRVGGELHAAKSATTSASTDCRIGLANGRGISQCPVSGDAGILDQGPILRLALAELPDRGELGRHGRDRSLGDGLLFVALGGAARLFGGLQRLGGLGLVQVVSPDGGV